MNEFDEPYERDPSEWAGDDPKPPVCAHCGWQIPYDEPYYVIEDVTVCDECLVDYCNEHHREHNYIDPSAGLYGDDNY